MTHHIAPASVVNQVPASTRRLGAPPGPADPARAVLRIQAAAGNRAVSRALQGGGAGHQLLPVIQRMKIGNVEYGVGSTPAFRRSYRKATGRDLDAAEIMAQFSTDEKGFSVLYNVLAKGSAEFEDLAEFVKELNILRRDWRAQKLFYEKPGDSPPGGYSDVLGQDPDAPITLYSARDQAMVQDLLWWALQNGIPVEGLDDAADFKLLASGQQPVRAPLKGHLADRSHTVKHARQKRGSWLVSIVLNGAGTKQLRNFKADPENVDKGGEGYVSGNFGLKSEEDYVSVALGANAETWEQLKRYVAKVRVHRQDATGVVDVPARPKRRGRDTPDVIEGVGRVVNVPGRGMNCLIWAIYRALNIEIAGDQVDIVRRHLEEQGVAATGRMLDLADAAGGVLIAFLVGQGVIAAGRGIQVYTPSSAAPHSVVAGVQPINLWLSGSHFQAVVPG